MKMIVLLVKENQAAQLIGMLMAENYRVTKISSTGGFLRKRVETLLFGVDESQSAAALQKIESFAAQSGEAVHYFILDVKRFERV